MAKCIRCGVETNRKIKNKPVCKKCAPSYKARKENPSWHKQFFIRFAQDDSKIIQIFAKLILKFIYRI